jgi:hypothetical protein
LHNHTPLFPQGLPLTYPSHPSPSTHSRFCPTIFIVSPKQLEQIAICQTLKIVVGGDISTMDQRRIIIKARLTDIEGLPEERVKNLGQTFCANVLQRDLNLSQDLPRDEMHFLPNCHSVNPVPAWFIYDLNYMGKLGARELEEITHEVYSASLVNHHWYEAAILA